MKQTKELDKKIAALRMEHEFKGMVADVIPGIDTLAYLTGHENDKKRILAKCKTPDEFKAVLAAFPATNSNTIIGTASDKYYADLATPYRLDIDNPARPNQWHNFAITIAYTSGEIDIKIELPIQFVADYVTTGERGVTDSEYHYFTGSSYQELRKMRVRAYNFKANQMGWYGGNKTLLDVSEIGHIISHLNK